MSQFTTPCKVEVIGRNLFQLVEPFEYHVGVYPSDEIISVPAGFITDFASVPRIFWPVISPIDKHAKAAVLHDYLYYSGIYNRYVSDWIFRQAMIVLCVEPWKRECIYRAVRYFGWHRWSLARRIVDVYK